MKHARTLPTMPQMDDNKSGRDKSGPYNIDRQGMPSDSDAELERLLIEGVSLTQETILPTSRSYRPGDDDEDNDVLSGGDVQEELGLFAEVTKASATAGVELVWRSH